MSRSFPEYQLLAADKTAEMLELFKGEKTGWVQVGEKKYVLPYRYIELGPGFFNFKCRPSDTWVVSNPRSGTTEMQELVWLVCNNCDFNTAKKKLLATRFPFFEFSMLYHPEITKELVELSKDDPAKQHYYQEIAKPIYEEISADPGPRFFKTHFALSLVPGILDSGCKVVYMARNPKEVAVSWYFLNRACKLFEYVGNFSTFWKLYKNDLILWGPYWEHLKEAWAQRNNPNLLFVFYEDMNQDLPSTIKKVADFFDKAYSNENITRLVDHLNFRNFKSNPMVNKDGLVDYGIMLRKGRFVRRGVCGGWNEKFTHELEVEANKWIEENLKGTDLKFPPIKNYN